MGIIVIFMMPKSWQEIKYQALTHSGGDMLHLEMHATLPNRFLYQLVQFKLKYWSEDKMFANPLTMYANAFSWMKKLNCK